MSQPDAVSSAICCSVASTAVVGVVVIDCPEVGASPPTSTLPTRICRERRRSARTGGGGVGIPSSTKVMLGPLSPGWQFHWVHQIRVDQEDTHHDDEGSRHISDWQQLGDVD